MRIEDIFEFSANELWATREKAIKIHQDDIKASGNEVEKSFNDWLNRILPTNVNVLSGHIVGKNGHVSPQIDTIITDSKNISTLFTAEDGTKYVPISSVYAVGEIKSTFSHHKDKSGKTYIDKFVENKEIIDEKLGHILEKNTFEKGLSDDSMLEHILINSTSPWLNKIFHFLFCLSKGTSTIENLKKEFMENEKKYLPNITIMMDSYSIYYSNDNLKVVKYPEKNENGKWVLNTLDENRDCSIMANNLGFFYYILIEHINNSFLNDRNVTPYFKNFLKSKRSSIITFD